MIRSICALCVLLLLAPIPASADLLVGDTAWDFGSSPGIDMSININTDSDVVDIVMSGRDDGWFGIGFGASVMNGTYGIVVYQDGSFDERSLNYAGGSILTSSLTLMSSSVTGSERTMHFQRDRIGISGDHFTFQDTPGLMELIGASNAGGYNYHGANRSPNSVMLNQIPEPASGVVLCLLVGGIACGRRRACK